MPWRWFREFRMLQIFYRSVTSNSKAWEETKLQETDGLVEP